MIKLIKNVRVFRQGDWRPTQLLIAGKQIAAVEDDIDCRLPGMEVLDGQGMRAIPGYIDQHVHITGGGGEGGFANQVPPLRFSAPVKAGITTLVGLLGTDGTTRSVESLCAKTKALNECGLTAFFLTGAYEYPSPTITGSVRKDITMIQECIGVKIAISDHRSAGITREELIRLASDAHQAGILSGKPGIVHLHTGSAPHPLGPVFDALEHSQVPVSTFRPTHLAKKLGDALPFAAMGGYIDLTCDPDTMEERCGLIAQAMDAAPDLVTLSTDGNGSMPVWNEKKEMIGIGAGSVNALHQTVQGLVKYQKMPLERAIRPVTENPARALGLAGKKGCLDVGADADLLLLDESLNIRTVMALGRVLLRDGEMQVRCNFEEL